MSTCARSLTSSPSDESVGDTPLDQQLLSVPDALSRLGVGRTTFYRLLSERQIEAVKIYGRTLVVAESIDRFVAGLPRWGADR